MAITSHPLYENLIELQRLSIEMKREGWLIDESARNAHQQRLSTAREAARLNFLDLVEESGYEAKGFNVASSKQISALFYEHFGLRPQKAYLSKTTGLPGVNKSALQDIIREESGLFKECAQYLQEYRENDKYESTYVGQGYAGEPLAYGLPVHRADKKVHLNWSPGAAETWRSKGDGQQFPKHVYSAEGKITRLGVRDQFIAPEGYTLIEGDYSQQELRKVALYSGCQPLITELTRPGGDAHALFTRSMFKIPEAVWDKKKHKGQRDLGKTLVFAILIYGGSCETGWRQVVPKYPKLTVAWLEQAKENCYLNMPELPAYHLDQVKFAHKRGYTSIPNTPYIIPWRFGPIGGDAKSGLLLGEGERSEIINKRIQTSCAIMMNAAMLRVARALYKLSPLIKIIAQIHDALFVIAPDHLAMQAAKIMKDEMEQEERYLAMWKMFYPVDIKMGKRWGTCPWCLANNGARSSQCDCLQEVKV